jgi:hypothetical protein
LHAVTAQDTPPPLGNLVERLGVFHHKPCIAAICAGDYLDTKALACRSMGAVQRLVRPRPHRRSTFYCPLLIILDRFVIHDIGGQPCGKISSTFVSTANCYCARIRQNIGSQFFGRQVIVL